MKFLFLILVILIILVTFGATYGTREGFMSFGLGSSVYSNPRTGKGNYKLRTHNGLVKGVQGDPFLADMYKRIYFLEGIARENIAINRDGPGSGNDVPRERIALENIQKQSTQLRLDIGKRIADSQQPLPERPVLDSANPMIGLPQVPGTRYMSGMQLNGDNLQVRDPVPRAQPRNYIG